MEVTADIFKRLYLPHPKLYRIAFALVGNQEEAEDIVQEVYSRLWERRDELAVVRNPEAYAITLTKHFCLDYLRSPRASRQTAELEETEEFQSDSSPEKETVEKDQIRQIQRWIDKLPLNQQQVLRLQGMEDYSVEEIEQITGYTAGNIRVLLSRARKTIREQFNKLYGK
mgnify:FL=1|jgi:RNA polymerase sigma-70 factor (ECF subfamily)